MSVMRIEFNNRFELTWQIAETPLSDLWLEKMSKRHLWPLDDPKRFYGFNDVPTEKTIAEKNLLDCISVINSYQPIIQKPFTSIDDQDLLNYLHHIFETYHGLLDQQNTQWWLSAPTEVQTALANLNIAVHRAESASRYCRPRFVCTWFGMPKKETLTQALIEQYGNDGYEFGGVYINYVEIGKTVEDLCNDDDQWIGDDAFRPFLFYSADFNVRFYDETIDFHSIKNYFENHKDYFQKHDILSVHDWRARPRRFLVARLDSDLSRHEILNNLSKNQVITGIYIT